jgi:hypothetical protein
MADVGDVVKHRDKWVTIAPTHCPQGHRPGQARSQHDPVAWGPSRAPSLPNAGVGVDGHRPAILTQLREDRPHAGREVVLPIRVGGVVVTDHKPGRR